MPGVQPFSRAVIVAALLINGRVLQELAFAPAAAAERRPNVLFISIDDLNDWVGCLSPGMAVRTPHIDRLAGRGVLFTNAHCPAPLCNPSRTAVLLGRNPGSTGIYSNNQWWRPNLPAVSSLPGWFKAHGYRVEGGGKIFHHTPGFNPRDQWHHFEPQILDDPWNFEAPVPGEYQARAGLFWPEGFPLNRLEAVARGLPPMVSPRSFDWGPFEQDPAGMGDGRVVAWASRRLADPPREPLFLAVGIYRPHLPWYAPRQMFALYDPRTIPMPPLRADDLDDIPPAGREVAAVRGDDFTYVKEQGVYRQAVQAYMACISYADALVGRLLEALDRSPLARSTIVILWSDHGFHLGEKNHWHKNTLWERATRVPLIIAGPGDIRVNARSSRPVGLIDLFPTLLDLCQLPEPPGLDGKSLRPLLRNPDAPWAHPALTTLGPGSHALRTERWRYIRYANGDEELYDHVSDPNEWVNLAKAADYKSVISELAVHLPKGNAASVPGKGAFEFDPGTYQWRTRQ